MKGITSRVKMENENRLEKIFASKILTTMNPRREVIKMVISKK